MSLSAAGAGLVSGTTSLASVSPGRSDLLVLYLFAFEMADERCSPLLGHARVVREQSEVVHVAQIRSAQDFLDVVIDSVEVDVGEQLTGEVADRKTSTAVERREQIVACKVEIHRLLRVRSIDDAVDEPDGARAGNPPPHVVSESFSVMPGIRV